MVNPRMINRGLLAMLATGIVLGCSDSRHENRPRGAVALRAYDSAGLSWRVVDIPGDEVRLYLQRRTFADEDTDAIVDSVHEAQSDVLDLLGLKSDSARSAALFFLGSREDMQRLAGRPNAGFVQPGEASGFFVWARGYRAPLRHELAHLYTFDRWGRPAAGDSAAWLVEGIGAWAGGACQGHSPGPLAAGLLADGRLPTIADLVANFRALPEDAALPAAGSLVDYIHATEGVVGLRRRWRSTHSESLPDSLTEKAWRSWLTVLRPARLDVPRVMREGC